MKNDHTKNGIEKLHSCDMCDYKTKLKFDLNKHVKSVHLKLRPFSCTTCDKTFTQKTHLLRHCKSVHLKIKNHKCDYCEMSFSTNEQKISHITRLHDNPNGLTKQKCEKCSFTAFFIADIKAHFNAIHGGIRPYCCNLCDKSYFKQSQLRTHLTIKHLEVQHVCSFCDKIFKQKCHLDRHIYVKHQDRSEKSLESHKCDICEEYETPFKDRMHVHKARHKTDREISCDICGKMVARYNMKKHMKFVHGEIVIRHKCDLCEKDFKMKDTLNAHKKRHLKKDTDTLADVNLSKILIVKIFKKPKYPE